MQALEPERGKEGVFEGEGGTMASQSQELEPEKGQDSIYLEQGW